MICRRSITFIGKNASCVSHLQNGNITLAQQQANEFLWFSVVDYGSQAALLSGDFNLRANPNELPPPITALHQGNVGLTFHTRTGLDRRIDYLWYLFSPSVSHLWLPHCPTDASDHCFVGGSFEI